MYSTSEYGDLPTISDHKFRSNSIASTWTAKSGLDGIGNAMLVDRRERASSILSQKSLLSLNEDEVGTPKAEEKRFSGISLTSNSSLKKDEKKLKERVGKLVEIEGMLGVAFRE